ncbi:metallo-beta-lactamase domain protein [Ostertagia ostertagi]
MEKPLVDQLVVGYAQEVGACFSASGSVTLVRSANRNILVDCGDPWNGEEILRQLSLFGLEKNDIHVVVITHGHIDHCGNLSMFQNATVYMDSDVASTGRYTTLSEVSYVNIENRTQKLEGNSLTLAPAVELRRCPGHTDHDLIVIVSNTERGRIVISGDIFECANDDTQWKEVSRYPDLQEKSRSEIEELADWIVPGHGPMFKNEKHR